MLARDSRAQTQEGANCIADMISEVGGRRAKDMVMRVLEKLQNGEGGKKIQEKMKSMMRELTCWLVQSMSHPFMIFFLSSPSREHVAPYTDVPTSLSISVSFPTIHILLSCYLLLFPSSIR